MENYIIVAVVMLIISLAGLYIYKAKKSGQKCIGCPHSSCCNSKNGGCCGCASDNNK